jgi:hypothetical protein
MSDEKTILIDIHSATKERLAQWMSKKWSLKITHCRNRSKRQLKWFWHNQHRFTAESF